MKKPTLAGVLAQKTPAVPEPEPPRPVKAKPSDDGKMTTSLRIVPARLEALKIIAFRKRVRVNDLVLQGIDHVIALNKELAA